MSKSEWWSLIVQAVAAVGAVAVAILAIWGEWVRAKLAAPRLELRLRSPEGEMTTLGGTLPVRYYHFVASNRRAWAPARNVLLYLSRVEKLAPDDTWYSVLPTGPIALNWQFEAFLVRLPSIGRERYCDLGRLVKDDEFELLTRFLPNNFDPKLKAGEKLRAYAIAVADNGVSPELCVEVAWDGHWQDGAQEMARHLVIKEVRADGTS